jgi:integrase
MDCRARGLAPGTVSTSYGYPLVHVFLPWCAENRITDPAQLDTRVTAEFSVELLRRPGRSGKPISKYTAHAYSRSVRGFLNWCQREGEKVPSRPSLPRLPRRTLDVLSRDEIDALELGATSERDRVIIRILGDCGLRASEVCSLQVSDIKRHDRQSYLQVNGKGDRQRLVPVVPLLLRRIERYERNDRPKDCGDEHLFLSLRKGRSGDYEPLTRSGLFQLIENAAIRSGMEARKIHPHLLRHSFITNALRAGVSPLLISQIAGHTSLRMIDQVYSHLNASDGYAAMLAMLADARTR